MMKNTFTELEKKINEIQDYNNAIKKLLNISGNDTSALSVKKQFISAGGKVFHYSLIIVNAYGVVEWFTEHIIKAYLEDVSMLVDTYECLPETICNNHYSFTVELLKNKGKMVKYQHLKDEDIIRNLYTCFFDQDNFVINTDAFTYHSSNLRKDAINNMFINVGIENIINRITKNEEFRIAVKEIEGEDDSGIEMYTEDIFMERLNNIVERRNQIAHGATVDDIISADELDKYIIYVKGFLSAMYSEVFKEYLRLVIRHGKCSILGLPQSVFPHIGVIAFKSNHISICVNQVIIGYNNESNNVTYGTIESIRKETESGDESTKQITESDDLIIGIKTAAVGKMNYMYYIH